MCLLGSAELHSACTTGHVLLVVTQPYRAGQKQLCEQPVGTVLRGPAGTCAASGAVVFA